MQMNDETKDLLQMVKTTSKYLDARLTLDSGCCKCLIDYINWLKERMAYLERSNNRREETILDLREECGIVDELRKWLEEYEEKSYGLGSYETGISDALGDVLNKLNELEGKNE